ncbi:MAG: DUF885 domain-containing protein [Gemmatimonadales bacterium]|jgi:uncharacterized protein (DUF885 family)|nr:DUF885 domain-containing protein [Gemmatimonadales bacterium]
MQRRVFVRGAAGAAAGFGVLRLLAACGGREAPVAPGDHGMGELRDRYFLKVLELYPVTATYLGGDGYSPMLAGINGKLRDVSGTAIDVEAALYAGLRQDLSRIDPASLSPAFRADRTLMEAQLGFMLHQLADRRYHQRAVDTYVAEPFRGVDWQLQQLSDAGNGLLGSEAEWDLVLRRTDAIPGFLEGARGQLEAGIAAGNLPDKRMVARDGIEGSASNAAYFRDTLPAQAATYVGDRPFGPQLLNRLRQSGAQAARAWEAFGRFLADRYDRNEARDRFAVGEEEYNWRLRHCLGETRTAAELWEYGAREVAHYEERIARVAAEVATEAGLALPFGTPDEQRAGVRAVMDHLGKDAPANDDELLRWYVETGVRAVEYGRAHRLFDVPADYRLQVVPTPPVLRSSIDAAYYAAPPFKPGSVGRFYLTPTDNDPAALRLNNRASVATTALHEGFPGHDWHYQYMNQHSAGIANIRWLTPGAVEDSSSMWADSMAAEGWALYAEELMDEPVADDADGFYTPGERLYMLQGQLMRAVRVRVDTGLHTGRMTFDEAVDYFAAHVEFYPGARAAAARDPVAKAIMATASRAIYRYSKWPTQAITYNLGKHAIADLRAARRQAEGKAFDLRRFHERLMAQGAVPPAFLGDALVAE